MNCSKASFSSAWEWAQKALNLYERRLAVVDAEEVFEAGVGGPHPNPLPQGGRGSEPERGGGRKERVAFHVEIDVAVVGVRQLQQPGGDAGGTLDELELRLARVATQLLHRGLVAQLGERLRGQVRHGVRGFELRELLKCWMPAASSFCTWLARMLATWCRLSSAASCALQWSCQWHWGHLAQGLGLVGSAVARFSIVFLNRPSSRRKYRE